MPGCLSVPFLLQSSPEQNHSESELYEHYNKIIHRRTNYMSTITNQELEGPEYETIYAFGGLCVIDSIEEIAHLNDLCDLNVSP